MIPVALKRNILKKSEIVMLVHIVDEVLENRNSGANSGALKGAYQQLSEYVNLANVSDESTLRAFRQFLISFPVAHLTISFEPSDRFLAGLQNMVHSKFAVRPCFEIMLNQSKPLEYSLDFGGSVYDVNLAEKVRNYAKTNYA